MLRLLDVHLRGIGQVMFQNHPLSGLLFLAALVWGAAAADAWPVLAGGLLGLMAGTFTARWLQVDAANLGAGLYGYNALLVGLALPTFLEPSPLLWFYVLLGGAVSVVCTLGTAQVAGAFRVAALTFPFVLVTWLLLLATYGFAGLQGAALPYASQVAPVDPSATNLLDPAGFIGGVLQSISQVFLKGDALSALLLLAGLAVSSLPAAAWGLVGAMLAVVTAHALGAESDLVSAGLMGFSPVLTAIALGAVFHAADAPRARVIGYALLGTVFTVVVQGALNVLLTPFGIPTLTAPFVLVTWLFLLPRAPAAAGDDGS
ncbi:MAG: urea transporter [Proteobacteria bacterium]|nr:urea transporter [Pseudomonadota bacterium]